MVRFLNGVIVVILVLCLFSGCDLSGFSSEPARRLIKKKCTSCHTSTRIYGHSRSREAWQQIVARMERHGAVLNADEKERILQYLYSEY